MSELGFLGPIYDLGDGTRLQDLDGGCNTCGKRLSVVVHDPFLRWNAGQIVCIDCGTVARRPSAHEVKVGPFYKPGLVVARCSCKWSSLPGTRSEVGVRVNKHREQAA